jgi:hypothetical protein
MMLERAEIRKARIRTERLRWQKVDALAKAIRHRSYRVRNADIAEALIRETLMLRPNKRNENA